MFQRTVIFLAIFVLTTVFIPSYSEFHYSSKTPYESGKLEDIVEPRGCRAVHLNMVLRHGSRYPCSETSAAMFRLLEQINEVHKSKPYKYRNLTLPWNLPGEYRIAGNCEQSDAGNKEIFHLAERFKSKFPSLFEQKYWNSYYKFVASGTPRAVKSAIAFGYGLFHGNGTLGADKYQPIGVIFSGLKDMDKILRYYNTCPRYTTEVVEGNGLQEWRDFRLGNEMKGLIAKIEERLQIKGKVNLTADMAQKLFWFCAFATMNQEGRDWCSVFNQDDVDILEYEDDVNQYYRHSYGNGISYKTNCPLVADITNSLNSFVNKGLDFPYGIFRFTHIGTITALQSLLGMYQDSVPLRADNFAQQTNRTYRISKNVPMAANLAFVLYKCDEGGYKVQVLVNERPAVLPCCEGGSVCSLTKFMSCYESICKDCDFDAMCEVHSVASSKHHTPLWWAMPLLTVLGALLP